MKSGGITITTVRYLEVGDQFAMQFLNGVISGTVTGLAHTPYDLTEEQREYMLKQNLMIPENPNDPISSQGTVLVLGSFSEALPDGKSYTCKHMFMSYNQIVACFPKE